MTQMMPPPRLGIFPPSRAVPPNGMPPLPQPAPQQPGAAPQGFGAPPMMPPAPPPPQPMQAPVRLPDPQTQVKPLLTDEEFRKLRERVMNSYSALEPHRKQRLAWIKQYVGEAYGSEDHQTAVEEQVVNLLSQAVNIWLMQLVSGNPKALIVTNKLSMKASVRYFELAFNHVLDQIDIRNSLKYAILESLFSMGIMKVGVEDPSQTQRMYPFDVAAVPFAEAVFFEDWVHDTTVPRKELWKFYGDRYREHVDNLKSDPRNDQAQLKDIQSEGNMNAFEMAGGTDSAEKLSGAPNAFEEEDRDYIRLFDIYVPRKKILVTFLANGSSEKPLRVVKWDGPPEGPYFICRHNPVQNNTMPRPPIADVAPLASVDNKLFMKMVEQASRQKTIVFANLGASKDAERIVRTSDGEVVPVTHPDGVREMKFGGVTQENLTFSQFAKARWSFEGGNLDVAGGLGSDADTLGQEQMLKAGSSGRIQMMQHETIEFTKQILRAIGWYLWNDPIVRINVTDKIPQTDIQLDVQWPRQQNEWGVEEDLRKGEYNDLNFDIEPYSMVDQGPGARVQMLRSIVQQEIIPLMPILQQAGLSFDMPEYLRIQSNYLNLKELTGIVKEVQLPAEQQPTNLPEGAPKPANTTRVYDSRSTKGGGKPDQLAQIAASMPKTQGGAAG